MEVLYVQYYSIYKKAAGRYQCMYEARGEPSVLYLVKPELQVS